MRNAADKSTMHPTLPTRAGAMAMLAQANISQDMVAYLLKQFIS